MKTRQDCKALRERLEIGFDKCKPYELVLNLPYLKELYTDCMYEVLEYTNFLYCHHDGISEEEEFTFIKEYSEEVLGLKIQNAF